jgi:hypothetical protein
MNVNAVAILALRLLGRRPEPDSWPAVSSALERAGIAPLNGFTAEFIFRKCLGCDTKNIVKDVWYECEVCGSSLSRDWNFADSSSAQETAPIIEMEPTAGLEPATY